LIDVFGADHIATVPDVLAALKALNYDISKIDVLIHQFVTLTENGEQVKMSKRSGKSYTLDELIEEVGSDVVRFFFLMRGITTHLEFDLALAREQSDKNPVFYLQYAHARISSVLDTAKDREIVKKDSFDPILLKEKQELDLIKILLKFPAVVESSCEKCEPQILAEYLRELAAEFHVFYHDCRILGVDSDLQNSRLHLANITKIAMRNGLTILGINAPDRM
jgi:arginyl-tRNA synthetase